MKQSEGLHYLSREDNLNTWQYTALKKKLSAGINSTKTAATKKKLQDINLTWQYKRIEVDHRGP